MDTPAPTPRPLPRPVRRTLMRGMLLWPLLRGGSARAERRPDADDARRSIGMVLGAWRDGLERDAEVRGLAAPSETQRAVAQMRVRQSIQDRLALETQLARLPPEAEDARALAAFVQAWPLDLVAEGVLAAPGSRLDRDLKALARHFPDRSSRWRTPFPFFRP